MFAVSNHLLVYASHGSRIQQCIRTVPCMLSRSSSRLCWSRGSQTVFRSRVFAARELTALSSNMQQQQGPRGAFILFEGVDRCGKSTQTSLLAQALEIKGVAVEYWNFPDRKNTVTGHAINEYLAGKQDHNDRAIHLLFSANRWEKSDALLRALQSGTSLVVDRYAYSGVAYSAAKRLAGMDAAWCKAPDAGLPAPDLVVYLELDNAAAAARAGFGGERYEKTEFQDKVRGEFQQLKEPSWLVVDAAQSVQQIHEQILTEALHVIRRCREGQPIQQLWGAAAAHAAADRAPLAEQQPRTE